MGISKINKVKIDYIINAISDTAVGERYIEHYDQFILYGGFKDEQEAKSTIIDWLKQNHKRREFNLFTFVYAPPKNLACPLYGEIYGYPKHTKVYEVHGFGERVKSKGFILYGYMSAKNKKQARQMMIELGCDAKLICYIANVGNCICLKYRKPRK